MLLNGCGSTPNPGALTYIKGYWTKIKYTETFTGTTSCWSIFGDDWYVINTEVDSGLLDIRVIGQIDHYDRGLKLETFVEGEGGAHLAQWISACLPPL